jgi:hypothetical protein
VTEKPRLQADLERLTEGIRVLRQFRRIMRGEGMGKLSSIAERIKDTKDRLEKEADKLAAKLDTIDAAAPKAFDRGHAFLDSQRAEVDEIEDTLRQLSNLPLERLPDSPTDSGEPAGESKPSEPAALPKAPTIAAPVATPSPGPAVPAKQPFRT